MRNQHFQYYPYSQVQASRNSRKFSSSTLKVPRHLEEYMGLRIKQHKGLRHYFEHLIRTYALNLNYFGGEQFTDFCKKKYQAPTKNYRRYDFKPDQMFWESFRNLSFIYGPSMCYLFVHLVKLEQKRWQEAGQPENFRETPPPSRPREQKRRNSNHSKKSRRQILREILKIQSRCTILVRVMDSKTRMLTRTGLIQ